MWGMSIALPRFRQIFEQALTMTPETPKDPANGFVERTAQAAHQTIDEVAEKAGETLDRLQASASSMGEQLSDKAQALSDLEYQMVEKVRDCVRDHPLASLFMAVAAGVLIARLTQPTADPR